MDETGDETECEYEEASTDSPETEHFTEYVPLQGRTYHQDCQHDLKICRELIVATQNIELRLEFEPQNERDKNGIIVEAYLPVSHWTRVEYLPKEKVPKFTKALRQNEIRVIKYKNILSITVLRH